MGRLENYLALAELTVWGRTGSCLNIKMCYQYRNSHDKDKTVSIQDHILIMEITISVKTAFIWRRGPLAGDKPLSEPVMALFTDS